MSEVSPLSRPNAPALTPNVKPADAKAAEPTRPARSDRADFSSAAQLLGRLDQLPDTRDELITRVKQEIALGAYETPEKIDAAIEELLKDL
ncbi:MAG: flagellar biosynthesis anti-sigma factor FlgM [Phycisphaeraceae bacterium]|nr:flagellar biosynthesis anti-sigma factor FlgM [Phycisphaeraceae bacterium]